MINGRNNGIILALIFGALLGTAAHSRAEVKLIVPAGYLPNVPYLARVEVRDGSGARDWSLWNAEAILSVDQTGVTLSTNRILLRNGLGTALLTISGNTSFNLTATVNGERAARNVTDLTGQPVTTVTGTLPGTSTTWSGIVNVTGSVTIPNGHTLTIQSNTLVLINGVASGTSGIRITVNGAIQSLGTELHPVTITTSNSNLNWGQIRHDNAQTSFYQYTFISKAGRAPGEGHTGTGPALRPNNSTLVLESSVISDMTASGSTIGKIMQANGSTLTLRDSVLTRARMGPEIASTGLVCTNSYILEMSGPDDGDGIYLHSAGGRALTLSGCVIASGTDDAVDTLDSNVTLENCIIRDWPNPNEDAKGISAFHGEVTLRRCLIANCFAGVVAKSGGPLCVVRIDQCTIIGLTQGVGAVTKANASAGNINFYISNSVVLAPDAVYSDFGPEKFVSVTYCNLSEAWPGAGNISSDPLFVNAAAGDFRLQPGSPLIDAADPASPLDPDGTRTEIGYFLPSSKANSPPVVSLTSPANDATFDAPASFTITVTAQDLDGTVSNVVFYANGAKVGEDATSPYTLAWSDVPAGNYALSAVATDAAGLSNTSSVVNVFVKASLPPPAAVDVVISEIMYHPASENPLEEFIELFNRGSGAVNLQGWRFSDGVDFTFPDVAIPAGGYLVVAADLNTFRNKYPGVANVVGNWTGLLSNSSEDIDLDDAKGNRVDSVQYADEGDWAARRRGRLDRNHRGWAWFAEHDGLGRSLELINPSVSNNHGQNWASSRVPQGTPGQPNSVLNTETAPLIQDVSHLPAVPRSTDTVRVTAQVSSQSNREVTVMLNYRVDRATPPPFTALAMRDDGSNGDASAGDGIFSAIVPAQTNNTVVEFYVAAGDALGNTRTWPAPAIAAADGAGPTGQVANALFQVDNAVYTGSQPLYKLIMTETERAELAVIPSQSNSEGPNSEMNGTFISIDGTGTESHYLTGLRNRGHGSRTANPPNYHVAFRRDNLWKGVTELNLNSQQIHMQHFGSTLANRSGALGTYSHAAQVRVNGVNRANAGGGMFGSYAANEVYGSDWAQRHLPFDGDGNVYRVVRDIRPPNFDYRGANVRSYTNTYFKETNVSEDDWTDLIGMLQVMGENSGAQFTLENIRGVINLEQWLTHLAVMSLFANGESGLNTGNNDDYFMYRGMADRRFLLLFHDLDQILSVGSLASNTDIFRATGNPISGDTEGVWRAMARFLRSPDIEPLYRATLQRLLDTTFSKPEFDTLIDNVLGSYVPQGNINSVKTWMDARRASVRTQLGSIVFSPPPVVTLSGAPRSPTPRNSATITVAGPNVTHYQYSLNNAPFSEETPVGSPIQLASLASGTNTIAVIGRNSAGVWQAPSDATVRIWIVDPSWPTVRLNEVLAWNTTAVNRSGSFPDTIELYNEGAASVNLSGLRLSDDPANPGKYNFASGTMLASGAYLVLDANQLGFSLDQTGEGVYLFNSTANGGALLDSVEFGFQVADLSMGRLVGSDDWTLTQPTFGSENVLQVLGDSKQIKINEWLAFGASPNPDDFVELYNPQSLPVEMGGNYLTDQPAGAPKRSRIAPLNFISPRGYRVFTSGNGSRPNEINFNLASEQGELALVAPDLSIIDSIVYGSQRIGVSNGRCPDGAATQRVLETPTPGGPNQCPSIPAPPQGVTLIPFNYVWKYEASGTDLGALWRDTGYDDAAWRSGPGMLGFESSALPQPLLTSFANAANPTYYFRTQFNVDPGLAASSVQVTHFVDDGAAFYLNGREVARYNLPAVAGYQTFATANLGDATSQTFTIPADQLRPGVNNFAAEVHQINAASSDVVFGFMMQALVLTNSAAQSGILINEVLAFNDSLEEPDGRKPDWIELYNPSATTVDLAGMSLSDDVANPRRWIFSAGSVLPGRGFLKIAFNSDTASSASNTGFALKANGGAVFLFNRPSDGGGLQSAVTYGLQAADWSIGRVPDGGTNWVLNIPTLGTANIAASLGNPQLLKINEWMADPASGEDWFEIFNPNPQPVDLSRFWVSDSLSTVMKHALPALSFIGNGAHAFQQFIADENPVAGADHVNFKLGASGDALALSAPNGALLDGLSFAQQITGVSQGRLPDGGAGIVNFTVSPTPGSANFLPLSNVFINELLSHTDPPLQDAVELHNSSAGAVDIGGWFLSDSAQNLRKFPIPAGTVIPAGGYVVFYEYQFNRAEAGQEPFSFSSARGEEVNLSQALNGALTGYRSFAAFDAAENGVSFGRVSTSQGFHFVPMARRTFGRDNPATLNEFVLGTGAANADAKVGPVVISEIMYHPAGTNDVLEFLELHNVSAAAVPLYDPANPANTWRLRKGIEFDFPSGTSLSAGGFLVVVSFNPQTDAASLAAFRSAYGTAATLAGPYTGKLKDSGDTFELRKPDPPQTVPGPDFGFVPYIVVDRIDYLDAAPWPASADGAGHSLHKSNRLLYGNDPMNWTGAAPNPGAEPSVSVPSDSDNDGLPNDWEIANGLNPNDSSDAAADSDGDGLTNLQEYAAGTNPKNAASALRAGVRINAVGGLALEFTAAANRSYAIEFRDSLIGATWQKLTDIASTASERVLQLPITTSGSVRFFRIVLAQ